MGFWIFMFIIDAFVPVTMIVTGKFILSRPPKMNYICGYRTSMSMKNADTWDFANRYCGKLWCKTGCVMLPVSVFTHLPFINSSVDVIGIAGCVICLIQCAVLVATIVPVEKALKKNFDKFGFRKTSNRHKPA